MTLPTYRCPALPAAARANKIGAIALAANNERAEREDALIKQAEDKAERLKMVGGGRLC